MLPLEVDRQWSELDQKNLLPGTEPSLLLLSAYHGHLSSLIDISPYKFQYLDGQKEWVHVVCTTHIGNRLVPTPKPG